MKARRKSKVVSLDAFRERRKAEMASLAALVAEKLDEMDAPPAPIRASVEDVIDLGTSLSELGNRDGAEYAFRLALTMEPANVTATFNLAVVLEDAGDFAEAIQTYQATLALDPHFADAHFNLSLAYGRMPDRQQSEIRHLNEYRKLTGSIR